MKNVLNSLKALLLCLAIVFTPGCGQQPNGLPRINGVEGPLFNFVDGQVLLTFKFLNMQMDAGLKVPIPKTTNSFMEFSPNAVDGGMMLQLFMDIEDLRTINIGAGDGNYLPDGRPLPGVPGGRLENSLRIDTEWYDVSFYYHKKLFGLWIPVGFETAGISGYWNVNINQKRIGFLGIVGNEEERNLKAGGIILMNLDILKDQKMLDLIEKSKRNPGVMF
jgi:hypothetical protein